MQVAPSGEACELGIDQGFANRLVEVGRQERVETEADVDIGLAGETLHQRVARHVAITHARPGDCPGIVGNQPTVNRVGQRARHAANHFRRIPVRHLTEQRCHTGDTRPPRHELIEAGADLIDRAVDGVIGDGGPVTARGQCPDLEDKYLVGMSDAEFDVEAVARAEGVAVSETVTREIREYMDSLPAATRSSMLIDLSQGKRIEVEALRGTVVRRGQAVGVPTPIIAALYAVLTPHAGGVPA